jgi:uncharacterized protein (DUF3820 family)
MTTLSFGKHSGEDIEDIPTAYLKWFLEKVETPNGREAREAHLNLCSEIEDELAYREKNRSER